MARPLWSRLRTFKLTTRIWASFSLLLLPFLLLLHFYHSAIEGTIEENLALSAGFKRVQQLAQLQEQIAQFRGLQHGAMQSRKEPPEKIRSALEALRNSINGELHQLNTPYFIEKNAPLTEAITQLWQQLSSSSVTRSQNFSDHTQLISMLQQLIKQIADSSAPRFNPDDPERTVIYSLSTHTIPSLKEQMGRLRGLTYGAMQSPDPIHTDQQFRSFLPILRAEIATHRTLIRDQLATSHQNNPALYQESFTLFSDYSVELAALMELLDWKLEESPGEKPTLKYFDSPEQLFQQLSKQIKLLDQLNETLLTHVSNSLQQENRSLNNRYRHHVTMLLLLLLLTTTSIFWVLYDHNRGNRQLSRYLRQKDPLQPGKKPRFINFSHLDREHRQIWKAYRRMERHLEHEAARLLTLKQGVDRAAMIMITDLQGTILYTNESLQQRTGYSEAELQGENPRILQSGLTSDETYSRLWKTILDGQIWKNQVANRDHSGEIFWVEETIVPLLDDQDEIQEFFSIHIDITTRMIAEQRLADEVEELKTLQTLSSQTLSTLVDEEEASDLLSLPQIISPEADSATEPHETIRILAVDDELTVLDSYKALLKNESNQAIDQLGSILHPSSEMEQNNSPAPFHLECVTSGEQAVKTLRKAKEQDTPYQVVYLDMLMPGGWDGLKTAQEILRIDPMVRIIVVSAWSDHTPNELQPVLGNHFIYLKKPFSREELLQLTYYMAEDWRRTQQLIENRHSLSRIMKDLQQSNEQRQRELDHQQIYQMILVTLSTSAPLYSGDRSAGYNEITQSTLEALGVDRVTLWHLEEEEGEEMLVADDCYSVKEQSHQQGERYAIKEYEYIWKQITTRQVVRIDDTEMFPGVNSLSKIPVCTQGNCYCTNENNYFRQHNIRALMIAPIFYNNQHIGIIAAEVVDQPREWRLEEATFLSYVSNLVPTVEISAERKDAELRAESANRAKDDFLATMSHELRTPLSSMIGYGDILSEGKLSTDQHELVDTMQLAGKTLLSLVNDILDISKIEAGKFELDHAPFSLPTLLHEMEMMFSPKAELNGITFSIETAATLPAVQLAGDERRISQILMNLIGNAIKFTSEGSVTLRITHDPTEQQDEHQLLSCHFAVVDSGIGIAQDTVDRLFQPFEQADGSISRSFGGTGLGLYISRVLTHLMDGEITLESIEGKGSTFTVTIPLELTELPLSEQHLQQIDAPSTNATRLKGRVLIVEDTMELQQLERRLVESTGATVETANDGEEGLAMGLSGSYDLILMDMQMPNMDGITATQLLRSSSVSTPIVALTANVMQQHRDQFNEAGCNDFLSKPIDRAALRKVLSTHLEVDEEGGALVAEEEMGIAPELLALFMERMAESAQQLETDWKAQAWDELQGLVHTLKGAGASFGFPAITEQAKEVEQLLLQQRHEEIDTALQQLLETLQALQEGETAQ